MLLKKICTIGLASFISTLSFADVDAVKTKLAANYPNIQISHLQETEMKGLYSGTLEKQVVYVNEEAQHLFIGSMIRLKDQENLTKKLVLDENSIDFKSLPLKDAIKL